jgi:RNA polymerase sigma-70 factor (ECF subfamily)
MLEVTGRPGPGRAEAWNDNPASLAPEAGRDGDLLLERETMEPGAEDSFVDVTDLIARARAGDRGALGTLLDRYRGLLRRLASQGMDPALGRRLDASDLVQQTFLEAAESFERFRGAGEAELAAWLRRILEYNLAGAARDHLFRRKRAAGREASLDESRADGAPWRDRLASPQTSPSLRAVRLEQAALFFEALGQLPPDQREAVRLRHVEGLPIDEIAARLGRSPEAAAGLLKRGLHALRNRLREREEPTDE